MRTMSKASDQAKLLKSPLKKGVWGILSPCDAIGNDEIPPPPFTKGGGTLSDIVDWTKHWDNLT